MIKVKNRKILLLPGDGIGPEVIREVKKIIEWFNKNKSLDFKIEEAQADQAYEDGYFDDGQDQMSKHEFDASMDYEEDEQN